MYWKLIYRLINHFFIFFIFCIFQSASLYPPLSRVGKGNLVLRHSVPHFLPNSGGIAKIAPERRNGNIHLSKYFISSSGLRTHNQSVLQSHFVPLRQDWPPGYKKQIRNCFKVNIMATSIQCQ